VTHEISTVEERAVTSFMQRLEAEPVGAALQLPDARIVWLKGQLIRQWDDQRKMLRPVEVMAPFEIVAGVAAAVLLLVWSVPSVFDWVPRLMF
jgi:hypothetical protein